MGRGRAKAKQQKVARELKYGGPDTDLSRLAAELSMERADHPHLGDLPDEEPDDEKYADWIEEEDGDDPEALDVEEIDERR